MNEPGKHPQGFYRAYPDVTWDLAEERWLGTRDRSDLLFVYCDSCGWHDEQPELILAKPERRRIAEFIAECRHWYQCPGDPQVACEWFRDVDEEWGGSWLKSWKAWPWPQNEPGEPAP